MFMKVTLENIGVFRFAEYEIADLTIIAGRNNTGKTYATYSLYSFLDFFWNGFRIGVPQKWVTTLLQNGTLTISLDISQKEIDNYLQEACEDFRKYLPRVFAAQEKYFTESRVSVSLNADEIQLPQVFDRSYKTEKREFLQIVKAKAKKELTVNLMLSGSDSEDDRPLRLTISRILGDVYKEILFSNAFRECFLASAERTGAVIFKDELNVQKNTLLREVAHTDNIDLESIMTKMYSTAYALPVRRDIDFIRNLDSISKKDGELYKAHPEIIEEFNGIVGGTYKVSKDGLYFIPVQAKNVKLTIGESASAVRSLLDMYFYLRHVARPGQMLMIDEPEKNLHPESQRRMARLLAKLVNLGIKVFVTTHSDYLVKEFNTLMMLKAREENNELLVQMAQRGYNRAGLIDSRQVKMYVSTISPVLLNGYARRVNIQTLVPAVVDPMFGIEATSFDSTINEMNEIQERIMFSSDGYTES